MILPVKAYCGAHKAAKALLKKSIEPKISFGYLYSEDNLKQAGIDPSSRLDLYYGENEGVAGVFAMPPRETALFSSAEEAWKGLVENCLVPSGWKNSGFCNVCYSKKVEQWCLSSWIWTSAAVARYMASCGKEAAAIGIAEAFLLKQHPSGGWIVRNDYANNKPAPMLAPNDSSYIANNALLTAYRKTGDERYLIAAKKCADWVVETSLESGLVSTGLNVATGEWTNNAIIVDIGFTAGLFADLCEIDEKPEYRQFLERFTSAYMGSFRDPVNGAFATSVDCEGNRNPGRFARGQAWALEGLIPAYKVTGSSQIGEAIDEIVRYLVSTQDTDGGWAYNLAKPLMGQDCKGVSVIAKNLALWGIESGSEEALRSATSGLEWCRNHTDLSGSCPGGIFSFCMEGAVTHYLYSEAAFVYASSYALETADILGSHDFERGRHVSGC